MGTVLVVEDDENLRVTLNYNLHKADFVVRTAASGPEAMALFGVVVPDLVLLDVMLPGFDGFEVCRRIRQVSQVPILMLTARVDEGDTVAGLTIGADDYISKPFRMRELIARVHAALRRGATHPTPPTATAPLLRSADLTLDPVRHHARRGQHVLTLKPRAFALLHFFMKHPQQVFSREQLLRQLWGDPFVGDPHTVDVHIRWIREQIEDDPSAPIRLRTLRHVGYVFEG